MHLAKLSLLILFNLSSSVQGHTALRHEGIHHAGGNPAWRRLATAPKMPKKQTPNAPAPNARARANSLPNARARANSPPNAPARANSLPNAPARANSPPNAPARANSLPNAPARANSLPNPARANSLPNAPHAPARANSLPKRNNSSSSSNLSHSDSWNLSPSSSGIHPRRPRSSSSSEYSSLSYSDSSSLSSSSSGIHPRRPRSSSSYEYSSLSPSSSFELQDLGRSPLDRFMERSGELDVLHRDATTEYWTAQRNSTESLRDKARTAEQAASEELNRARNAGESEATITKREQQREELAGYEKLYEKRARRFAGYEAATVERAQRRYTKVEAAAVEAIWADYYADLSTRERRELVLSIPREQVYRPRRRRVIPGGETREVEEMMLREGLREELERVNMAREEHARVNNQADAMGDYIMHLDDPTELWTDGELWNADEDVNAYQDIIRELSVAETRLMTREAAYTEAEAAYNEAKVALKRVRHEEAERKWWIEREARKMAQSTQKEKLEHYHRTGRTD